MRKITLTLIAAFMATVSFGQSKHAPLKLATEKVTSVQQLQLQVEKSATPLEKRLQSNIQKAATRAGEDMITEAPAGKKQAYERGGGAWVNSLLGLTLADQEGWMETVTSEDGKTIYFKDIISSNPADTWVAGTVNADGSVTLPMNQNVAYYSSYDAYITLKWTYFALNAEATAVVGYGYYPDVNEATFTVDADGVLTLKDSGVFEDEEGNIVYVGIGLFWTDDDTWAGSLDFASVYTPGIMPENIPAPEGLVTEDYTISYVGYDGSGLTARIIKAGWDGDDFWIQGLDSYFPDAWVKGTKKGDKVVFDTPQFIGFYSTYSIYLVGGVTDPDHIWALTDNIEMTYNEETKTLSMDPDHAMVSNAALDRIYYLTMMANAKIAPYVEVAATPATPQIIGYSNYYFSYGYDYITASIPNVGTNGEFLDPAKLSYILYVDGEPFTFCSDRMPYVEEDMIEIPYTFTDSYDIGSGGAYLYPYATAFKTLAIKSIYRGGGEVHESDIQVFETGFVDANETIVGSNSYTSFDGDEEMCGNLGTGFAESYDVAAFIQDANLAGAKVTGMKVITTGKTKLGRTGFTGWVSSKLGLKSVNGVKVADAEVAGETSFEDNVMTVTFAEPYVVPADGFFAGYSFNVKNIMDDEDGAPVMLAVEPAENGFFMHTSSVFYNWIEMGSMYSNAILPVILTFADGSIKEVGARFLEVGEHYVEIGEPSHVAVKVANNGKADINEIEYTIMVGDNAVSLSETLDEPLTGAYYGAQAEVQIPLPALQESGSYPVSVAVTKVNGIANDVNVNVGKGQLNVVAFVPKHRVLVEEYTGTWCGYCPRGMVGMKLLEETFGEDFVGVAYHNGDPMESLYTSYAGYPSYVAGFPTAYVNRAFEADPYNGTGSGIIADVLAEAAKFAPGEVSVTGVYDADNNAVNVTADAKFVSDSEGKYSIEFIAIENGLTGEDSGWAQSNYYDSYAPEQLPEGMEWLSGAGSHIEGLEFNEVFLNSTLYQPCDNNIPETIKANTVYTASYTFAIDEMYNTEGDVISQDVKNMEVIALIIDDNFKVVNAARAKVSTDVTGISSVNAEQNNDAKVYNLQGLRVNKGYKGIVIMNGKKYIAK